MGGREFGTGAIIALCDEAGIGWYCVSVAPDPGCSLQQPVDVACSSPTWLGRARSGKAGRTNVCCGGFFDT